MSSPEENLTDQELLGVLDPTAAALLDRHLEVAKEWFPHQFVPRTNNDYFETGKAPQTWSPDTYPLPEGVRSALFVNLLTEDNLPYYTAELLKVAEDSEAFTEWTRRWTAEEARHSIVMRDWVIESGALDPVKLERARMAQVTRGEVPHPPNLREVLVYVTFQELATQVAHRNTGHQLKDDSVGKKVMGIVAGDEGRHYHFYRDLAAAAFEIDPSGMVVATQRQLRSFEMPGTGITNFFEHSLAIARVGIYTYKIYKEQVVEPVLQKWGVAELEGLSDGAEKARERLYRRIDTLGAAAVRREERGAAAVAQ